MKKKLPIKKEPIKIVVDNESLILGAHTIRLRRNERLTDDEIAMFCCLCPRKDG